MGDRKTVRGSGGTILTARGYGTIRCHTIEFNYGMTIIADEETARKHRALYPWKVTSSSFEMTVHHPSMRAFRRFNEWMARYVQFISNPSNAEVGPLRVFDHRALFDRTCIPESGIAFGRNATDFAPRQTFAFIGASDPLSAADTGLISAGYAATYYEEGQEVGDYLSNWAVADESWAFGPRDEDALYDAPVPIAGTGWRSNKVL